MCREDLACRASPRTRGGTRVLSITTRRLSPALGHGRGLHEHYRCRKRDPDECLSRGPHKADGACGSVQKENARPWPHPVLYQPYLRLQRLSTSESGACASASHVSRVRSGVTRFPVACKFLRSTMSIFSRMILGFSLGCLLRNSTGGTKLICTPSGHVVSCKRTTWYDTPLRARLHSPMENRVLSPSQAVATGTLATA